MKICIYFQAHQPNRLKPYSFFDIGHNHFYEDDKLNKEVLKKVAKKCYLPANKMLLKLIEKHGKDFKVSFSLSGTLIEQFQHHAPEVIESYRELAKTGCVEFLGETFYHSLASHYSLAEFKKQVKQHEELIMGLFGQKPTTFRNTELIYNNEIADVVAKMGYKAILTEGVDWHLNKRTPNQVFHAFNHKRLKVLLRNHILSDDISFRFNNTDWNEHPLTPAKFSKWISEKDGDVVNLFMDYETIGEHNWKDTGIFDFWKKFPEVAKKKGLSFVTCAEAAKGKAKEEYNIPHTISWADQERDLTAWVGNTMQNDAIERVYRLEEKVYATGDENLINVWKKLQTSDHFYYMCLKFASDGDVHAYFSPYNSPHDAYIYYMNVLSDLEITLG